MINGYTVSESIFACKELLRIHSQHAIIAPLAKAWWALLELDPEQARDWHRDHYGDLQTALRAELGIPLEPEYAGEALARLIGGIFPKWQRVNPNFLDVCKGTFEPAYLTWDDMHPRNVGEPSWRTSSYLGGRPTVDGALLRAGLEAD